MSSSKLQLQNNLTGMVEPFQPLEKGYVRMYVCGITPYDLPHLGHGRCYVSFDVLYRLLNFFGYSVTYCRNFTDIDDKIIAKAITEFGDPQEYARVTARYIPAFHAAMNALGCLSPDHEPQVTENIDEIISFVQKLVDLQHAYVVDGDVYFSIDSFREYGKLSRQRPEDLRAGKRVELNDKKRDPLDFALWKSEAEGTFFKSPWGYGRPGWHIECSALARRYLGDQIDLHGGGRDLIFPHHENEIAQTESLTKSQFARFWCHNGFVQINREKMSKSLGNFFTLDELFQKFDPMLLRYYFVAHHYAAPLEFSFDDVSSLSKSYQRLVRVLQNVKYDQVTREQVQNNEIGARMLAFLCDDLNTPGMFGVVFENLDKIANDPQNAAIVAKLLKGVCGLDLKPLEEKAIELTPEIERLIVEREEAREQKDWTRADAIRDKLRALGYVVRDTRL